MNWQAALLGSFAGLRRSLGHANRALLKANMKEAIVSLNVNRQRTLLATIGILLGVASVTAMVSVGVTARAEAREQFQNLGTDTLVLRKYGGISSGAAQPVIHAEDVATLPGQARTIVDATPVLRVSGSVAFAGRMLQSNALLGVTQSFVRFNKFSLRAGRFISDLDTNRSFCVVGWTAAQEMLRAAERRGVQTQGDVESEPTVSRSGPSNKDAQTLIGDTVTLVGRLYTVVGVLRRSPASGLLPFQADESFFLPLTTAQRAFANAEIQEVVARMHPTADPAAASAEARTYFERLGVRVQVMSAEQLVETLQQQMRLFTLLLAAVGGISLVVGGAGAMNMMLTSVTERRKEIGVRRALGARRREIRNQFLIEAVALSLAGGLIGIVVGVALSYGICLYAGWSFVASPAAMALGFAVASGVGIFFGAYPASRAAALDPIAALRAA